MTATRYSTTAIFLHWAIALALALQIGLGWQLEEYGRGPAQFSAYQLHKSIGMAILVLSLLRLCLRYIRPRPPAFADSAWASFMSKLVHGLFYGVMIIGPLTGWILVSTAKIQIPTLLFGVVPLPHLPVGKALREPAEAMHSLLAWVAIGLLLLHVAGALRHQLVKQENILSRMLPLTPAGRGGAIVAVALALAAIGASFVLGGKVIADTPATRVPLAASVTATMAALPAPVVDAVTQATPEEAAETKPAAMPLSEWSVLPGGTLGFTATWNNSAITGSFGRWNSSIKFSPDDLGASTIRVEVDMASANSGDGQRDSMLQTDDFFNTALHPKAVFTSRTITARGGNRYRSAGTLNLHGKSQPVTLDFTLDIMDKNAKVAGSTRLDRTRFGVGSGEWAKTDEIAANVDIAFSLVAVRR